MRPQEGVTYLQLVRRLARVDPYIEVHSTVMCFFCHAEEKGSNGSESIDHKPDCLYILALACEVAP